MSKREAHEAMVKAVEAKDAAALRTARRAFQDLLRIPLTCSVEGERFVARAINVAHPKYLGRTDEQVAAIWDRLAADLQSPWMLAKVG